VKRNLTCRMKPYIQPFERTLALRELASVTASVPKQRKANNGDTPRWEVVTHLTAVAAAARLAYWETVEDAVPVHTRQVLREATAGVATNGVDLRDVKQLLQGALRLPTSRCLRYGPHCLHEYRGKFFPQLVRSLINIAGSRRAALVADPMCGSGTTLVEARLAGCTGLGLDMNPLSVHITRTKCAILGCPPEKLLDSLEVVRKRVLSKVKPGGSATRRWLDVLPRPDQAYLARWFHPPILDGLDHIASVIHSLNTGPARDLAWTALSNVLRRLSLQKEDDLRVRRDAQKRPDLDPIAVFLKETERSARVVLPFLLSEGRTPLGKAHAYEGDARTPLGPLRRWRGKIDVIITSPPYATALPYLDTDRLSLIFLRLLSRQEHRRRDARMIGNREVSAAMRRDYWGAFKANGDTLPSCVVRLVNRIDALNRSSSAGFRRRNLSALLAKYFFDMRDVFEGCRALLKKGSPAYIVIGNNHTVAAGKRIDIPTDKLLAAIACRVGFALDDMIPMDMLVSRDIFRRNSTKSETIVCLRRVQ
jgi:DNA modification methylase